MPKITVKVYKTIKTLWRLFRKLKEPSIRERSLSSTQISSAQRKRLPTSSTGTHWTPRYPCHTFSSGYLSLLHFMRNGDRTRWQMPRTVDELSLFICSSYLQFSLHLVEGTGYKRNLRGSIWPICPTMKFLTSANFSVSYKTRSNSSRITLLCSRTPSNLKCNSNSYSSSNPTRMLWWARPGRCLPSTNNSDWHMNQVTQKQNYLLLWFTNI